MENHPIPQDVTGFKFKLIGSITVKQFLYLLGFGILTTIAFVLQINILVKVPLMLLFAGIGASLAFLPIEGRPMDTMLVNFAKTIPAENRFIYKKRGANLSEFEAFMPVKVALPQAPATAQAQTSAKNDDKRAMLVSRLRNASFKPDEQEVTALKNINNYFTTTGPVTPVLSTPPPASGLPVTQVAPVTIPVVAADAPSDVAQTVQDKEKYEHIEQVRKAHEEVETAPVEEKKVEPEPTPAPTEPKVEEPKIKLSNEESNHDMPEPQAAPAPLPEKANPSLAAGFPTLPDVGNVVLGIVRDPRGKSLQNMLVEVIDANNLPVRAFKTNALGQFASATPLPNGNYKVRFEDPSKNHEFPSVDIVLNGEITPPIEATSVDAREKLRRELFGGAIAAA